VVLVDCFVPNAKKARDGEDDVDDTDAGIEFKLHWEYQPELKSPIVFSCLLY
jgi:hypothetical protein